MSSPEPPRIAEGARLTRELVPTDRDTASAVGNAGIDVIATTALILFFEETANDLIKTSFTRGEASVGARVEVDHLAPAFPGQRLRVEATLEAILGRRLRFYLEAWQGETLIMRGHHDRVLVEMSKFSAEGAGAGPATDAPPSGAGTIDFWFDVHSPWCYLAATRIGDIARKHCARLRWRPVHLANLNARIGGRRPLEENPAFVAWYKQDLLDQAALLRLPLRYHPDYPLRPSRALRAALYAAEQDLAERFVNALMRAYWADQRDISDLQVLTSLAVESGLTAARVASVVTDPGYRRALEDNLDEAITLGLFGVPTARYHDKLYFGNDHLDLLALHLNRRQSG